MTKDVFFKNFEHHLLIGSPKREEILAELKTHFDELGMDDPMVLGDPKALARKYNRTHLGLVYSPVRLFAIPVVVSAVIYLINFLAERLTMNVSRIVEGQEILDLTQPTYFMGTMMKGWLLLIPFLVVILVAKSLARWMHPLSWFFRILVWSFFCMKGVFLAIVLPHLGIGYAYDFLEIFMGGSVMALLFCLAFFAVGSFTIMLATPVWKMPRKRFQRRLIYELLLYGISGAFLSWYGRFISTILFVPYDATDVEVIPQQGTFMRDFNDFFSFGAGQNLLSYVMAALFLWMIVRRIVLYRKLLSRCDGPHTAGS